MSYDVDMVSADLDGHRVVVYESNITYNLRPMMVAAGLEGGPKALHGKTGREVSDLLYAVWSELRRDPVTYSKLDAPNGWGLYKHLVPWIKAWYLASRTYPSAIVKVY